MLGELRQRKIHRRGNVARQAQQFTHGTVRTITTIKEFESGVETIIGSAFSSKRGPRWIDVHQRTYSFFALAL